MEKKENVCKVSMTDRVYYIDSSNTYIPDRTICMTRIDSMIAHLENGGQPYPIFFQSQSCAYQTYPSVGSHINIADHGTILKPEDFCAKNDLKSTTCVSAIQQMLVPDNIVIEFYAKEIDNILEVGYFRVDGKDDTTTNVWSLDSSYNWDPNLAYNRFTNSTNNVRYLILKGNKKRWQRLPSTIKNDTKDNQDDSVYLCSKRIDSKVGEFKNQIERCKPNNNPQVFGAHVKSKPADECQSILSVSSCGSQFYPFFKPLVMSDNRFQVTLKANINNFYEFAVSPTGSFQECGNSFTSNFRNAKNEPLIPVRRIGSNVNLKEPVLSDNDQDACSSRNQASLGATTNYGSYWSFGNIFPTNYTYGQKQYGTCDCQYKMPSISVDLKNPGWRCPQGVGKSVCEYSPPCVNGQTCDPITTNIDRVEIKLKKPWLYTQVDSCIGVTPIQLAGVTIRRYEPSSNACDKIMINLCNQPNILTNNPVYKTACQCILKQKEVEKQLQDVDVAINCFSQVCNGTNPGVYRLASQRKPCNAKVCTQTIKLTGDAILNSGVQELKCGENIYNVEKVFNSRTSKDQSTSVQDITGGISPENSQVLNGLKQKQRHQVDSTFYVSIGILVILIVLVVAYGVYRLRKRRSQVNRPI